VRGIPHADPISPQSEMNRSCAAAIVGDASWSVIDLRSLRPGRWYGVRVGTANSFQNILKVIMGTAGPRFADRGPRVIRVRTRLARRMRGGAISRTECHAAKARRQGKRPVGTFAARVTFATGCWCGYENSPALGQGVGSQCWRRTSTAAREVGVRRGLTPRHRRRRCRRTRPPRRRCGSGRAEGRTGEQRPGQPSRFEHRPARPVRRGLPPSAPCSGG